MAGQASRDDHKLYIFDWKQVRVDRMLFADTKGDGLVDCAWHPRSNVVLGLTAYNAQSKTGGKVFIFAPVRDCGGRERCTSTSFDAAVAATTPSRTPA